MNARFFAFFLIAVFGLVPSFADQPSLASLQSLAAKGDAQAQFELGRKYQLGQGIPPDYAKATELYEKAAAQGNAKAMFNLGYIYRHGQGIAQDNDLANQWFQKAADHGLAAGQLEIGLAYYFGDSGLNKDYTAAAKWLTLAAKQTDSPEQSAPAANTLGTQYAYGMGVPRDGTQAAFWYGQAAEMGYAKGQANLGKLDYEGRLVKQDLVAAYEWMKLAAAQDEPLAVHSMSEYMAAKAFSPEVIAEGDRRVDEYQIKHHKHPIKAIPFVVEPESETTDGKIPPGMVAPQGVTNLPAAIPPSPRPAGH